MNENKQKKSVNFKIGVILCVLAGVFAIQTILIFITIHSEIMGYLSQGMSFGEASIEIINYYIEGCSKSLFYGGILFALGWIIMQKDKKNCPDNSDVNITRQAIVRPDSQYDDVYEEDNNDKNEETETIEKFTEN